MLFADFIVANKKGQLHPTRPNAIAVQFLLLTVFMVGIVTLPAFSYGGDPRAWREEARSLIARGELSIPESIASNFGAPGQFFVLNHRTGKYYSKYGVLDGILNVIPVFWAEKSGNDEVFCLGIFFVFLSGIVSYLLYDLTGYYTSTEAVRVSFVIICLYSTYLWNYLRATNSESTQLLFFLLCVRALFLVNREMRGGGWKLRKIYPIWIWGACLVLTKLSWILLLPLLAGFLLYIAWRETFSRSDWQRMVWLGIVSPSVITCALIGTFSWVKFGAPWLSGYEQWQEGGKVNFFGALLSLATSPQWSLFVSFPPLLLALFAWNRFWRKHKEEASFILAVFFTLLLLNGNRPNWRGEWCYGPRYFLSILPLLAIPLLYIFEWVRKNIRRASGWVTLCFLLLFGLFFVSVQWQVNRLTWFFKYEIASDLASRRDPVIDSYFNRTHFAKINWDYWQGRNDLTKIPNYNRMQTELNRDEMDRFLSHVRYLLSRPNLYWWPEKEF